MDLITVIAEYVEFTMIIILASGRKRVSTDLVERMAIFYVHD